MSTANASLVDKVQLMKNQKVISTYSSPTYNVDGLSREIIEWFCTTLRVSKQE